MKVLLVTISSDPPTLNQFDSNWSQDFKEFVSSCLQKDPNHRMSCSELLTNHKKFFGQAKDSTYIKENLLNNLPSLDERVTKVL